MGKGSQHRPFPESVGQNRDEKGGLDMDHRIHQLQHHPLTTIKNKPSARTEQTKPFQQFMQEAIQEKSSIKITKHAQKRLQDRNITIDDAQWTRLNEKLNEASNKGVQESLVVMKNAALIVNAKNQTVITAMNRSEAESQIFTNINGTILMDE